MFRAFYIPTMLIIAFSYPVTTVILLKIGADTGTINFYLKLIYFALSILSLFFSLRYAKRGFQGVGILLVFFAFYSFRVTYDVLGNGLLMGYQSPLYVLGYLFGLTIIPIVAMALAYKKSDLPNIMNGTLVALVMVNLFLFWHSLTAENFAADTAFSGRVEVAGDFAGTAVLNPLTFGTMGAMLAAMIIGLLTAGPAATLKMRLFYFFMLAISGVNILFSGSRGPAIAFILVIAVTLLALARAPLAESKVKLRQSTWLYVTAILMTAFYFIATTDNSILLVDRFTTMYENRAGGVTEERDYLYEVALADFYGSPFFGNSYILSTRDNFPHNIFLESLISTGAAGTAIFLFALFKMGAGLWRGISGIAGYQGYVLALSSMCLFTLALTSYSIGQSPELWIFAALITLIGFAERKPVSRAIPPPPTVSAEQHHPKFR